MVLNFHEVSIESHNRVSFTKASVSIHPNPLANSRVTVVDFTQHPTVVPGDRGHVVKKSSSKSRLSSDGETVNGGKVLERGGSQCNVGCCPLSKFIGASNKSTHVD